MRNIDKIIIHCSATKEGRDISAETIRSWHMKGRGWRDIGYHFVIELDGSLKEGRPLHKVGAHTKGENANSIGICYVGGVDSDNKAKDTRRKDQKSTMKKIIEGLEEQFPEATVHGHNEFSSKSCPCFDVQKEFAKHNKVKAKKESVKKENSDD